MLKMSWRQVEFQHKILVTSQGWRDFWSICYNKAMPCVFFLRLGKGVGTKHIFADCWIVKH